MLGVRLGTMRDKDYSTIYVVAQITEKQRQ